MSGAVDAPCGVPSHRMGRWEDVVLGIWWCPDCGEEIWTTEDADDSGAEAGAEAAVGPTSACGGARRADGAGVVPGVPGDAAHPGDAAGASGDRASGVGWRDRDGGARLWNLIVDAFGRGAE